MAERNAPTQDGPVTVQFVFQISGRGVVAAAARVTPGWDIAVGDEIALQRPDGTTLYSVVSGVEFFSRTRSFTEPMPAPLGTPGAPIPILVGRLIPDKDMVPPGTKIWVTKARPSP